MIKVKSWPSLLILLFSIALNSSIFAQGTSTGLKGGFNLTNVTSDNSANAGNAFGLDNPSSKSSYHIGFAGDTKIAKVLGIGVELLYSKQGTETSGTIAGVDFQNDFSLDYVTLPVLAKVYLAESFNFHAGIQPGYLFAAELETINPTTTSTIDLKEGDNMKEFDISKNRVLQVSIGYNFSK